MLQGHERAITQIKYNREGDLLFSSAKDVNPNVWYSLNGERLGTYIGHNGAVWCIDVDWKTTKFLSGAADNTLRLWDVATGNLLQGGLRFMKMSYLNFLIVNYVLNGDNSLYSRFNLKSFALNLGVLT